MLRIYFTWHVAMRPGKRRALPDTPLGACLRQIKAHKAGIRAKVEHPFRVIKRQFGYVLRPQCARCTASGARRG